MLEIILEGSVRDGIKELLLNGEPIKEHIRKVVLVYEKGQEPCVELHPDIAWDSDKAGLHMWTKYDCKISVHEEDEG